jgi:hypothetical protein
MHERLLIMAAIALAACSTSGQSRSGTDTGPSTARAEQVEGTEEVSETTADDNQAAQQAASTRPTEGAGGKNPHPVASETGEDRRYTEAPAQEPSQAGRPIDSAGAGVGSSSSNEISGRVALVNAQEREIAIDAGDATTQVKIAEDAEITVDGKKASLEDLRQGTEVRASLDRSGDEPKVTQLDVTTKAGR